MGTAPDAIGAIHKASFRAEHMLRLLFLTFGIVAPPAFKRAALEEDRGPYARAVVYGEPLDIKHNAFYHGYISSDM